MQKLSYEHGLKNILLRFEGKANRIPLEFRVGFLLALLLGIAFAPLVSGSSTLKWDALDCYLPWRWFVANALGNGVFPLWNPYQHLGYPIFADLRSVFSLEPYLVFAFGGYSLSVLHALFLFYLWLAGMGFYKLTSHFFDHSLARFISALAYMLSGFFVAHGQELFGLTAGAMMPWVLFYFLRLQRARMFSDVWKTAFFVILLLTGGYQALSIILFYLLLFVFSAQLVYHIIHREYVLIKKLIQLNLLLGLIVVASMTVVAVAWFQARPYVGRMSGITLRDAWFMPFSPPSLLSLFTPFATAGDPGFWNTDISMNNLYFGIILVGFAFLGMIRVRKDYTLQLFLFWGVICLLASMGAYTPVREFFFRYAPLMNLFRMSAWFSWFFLAAMIIAAGRGVALYLQNPGSYVKPISISVILTLSTLLLILGLHLKDVAGAMNLMFSGGSMHQKVTQATLGQRFAINAITQLVILSFWGILLWHWMDKPKLLRWAFLLLVIFDLVFAVKLNFFATVGSEFTVSQVQHALDKAPRHYPLPDIRHNLNLYTDNQRKTAPLWRNTHIFTQTVSAEGFNSFRLDALEELTGKHKDIFSAILQNPLVYFSADVHPWKDSAQVKLNKTTCFIDENEISSFPHEISVEGAKVNLKEFHPGCVALLAYTKSPSLLVMSQAWFPGWKASLDGHNVKIFKINGFQMGLLLPPGDHEVVFRFENPLLMKAFWLSAAIFFMVLVAIGFFFLKDKVKSFHLNLFLSFIFPALLYVGLIVSFMNGTQARSAKAGELSALLRLIEQTGDRNALLVTSGGWPYLVDSLVSSRGLSLKTLHLGPDPELSLQALDNLLNRNKPEVLFLLNDEMYKDFIVEDILRAEYAACDTLFVDKEKLLLRFHPQGKPQVVYKSCLDSTSIKDDSQGGLLQLAPDGKPAIRLDSLRRGSPSLKYAIPAEYFGKSLSVVASSHLMLTPQAGVALYIEVVDNNEILLRKTISTRQIGFPDLSMGWLAQTARIKIPSKAKNPVIQSFLWMEGDRPLWVDDLQLIILP